MMWCNFVSWMLCRIIIGPHYLFLLMFCRSARGHIPFQSRWWRDGIISPIYHAGMLVVSSECSGAGDDTQTEYRWQLFVISNGRQFSNPDDDVMPSSVLYTMEVCLLSPQSAEVLATILRVSMVDHSLSHQMPDDLFLAMCQPFSRTDYFIMIWNIFVKCNSIHVHTNRIPLGSWSFMKFSTSYVFYLCLELKVCLWQLCLKMTRKPLTGALKILAQKLWCVLAAMLFVCSSKYRTWSVQY